MALCMSDRTQAYQLPVLCIRIHPVGQENVDQLIVRIYPNTGTREAGMPVSR
jgi:hypothetical protein